MVTAILAHPDGEHLGRLTAAVRRLARSSSRSANASHLEKRPQRTRSREQGGLGKVLLMPFA